ncbi:MAG: T9SS type A sorting domain-containing protein [Bacteroidetes bacterium]|nr:T9SS type A sorting domain-containing protein [Bacteroidota bacterium]
MTFDGNKELHLFSIFGRKLQSYKSHQKLILNTSQLADGMYFIKSDTEVLRFVVAH